MKNLTEQELQNAYLDSSTFRDFVKKIKNCINDKLDDDALIILADLNEPRVRAIRGYLGAELFDEFPTNKVK